MSARATFCLLFLGGLFGVSAFAQSPTDVDDELPSDLSAPKPLPVPQPSPQPVAVPSPSPALPRQTTVKAEPAAEAKALPLLDQDELRRWERHVRGFRREHNFALAGGVSAGTWRIDHFGDIRGKNYDNSGEWAKFQYTYHLPLYEGFGYLLGSSTGYHYETSSRTRDFRPVPALEFPGVIAGLVMNFNPVLRLSVAADVYLERMNGIQSHPPGGEATAVSVTTTAYDGGVFFDVFYDLSWGLRLEGHRRKVAYLRPLIESGAPNFPVDASFTKDDEWVGLGVVYHLL